MVTFLSVTYLSKSSLSLFLIFLLHGRDPGCTLRSVGGLADINDDIWQRFQAAYAALDVDAFLAFHAPELVRIEAGARRIDDLHAYAARMREGFARARELGDSLAIDFHFDERIMSSELACERGVYQVTITAPTGAARSFHGRFHTVSRRIGGRWRLIVDHDDDEGGAVDATRFAAAHPMDAIELFESDRDAS
jgi:ketosteroid isomerase-like protein